MLKLFHQLVTSGKVIDAVLQEQLLDTKGKSVNFTVWRPNPPYGLRPFFLEPSGLLGLAK